MKGGSLYQFLGLFCKEFWLDVLGRNVKYWEISNSEGTFIIKKFAVSALRVQIQEILKIQAKMNEQMSVCPF